MSGQVAAAGVFEQLDSVVGPLVVKRELEYDGKKLSLYFRKISGAEAEDFTFSMMGKDGKLDVSKAKGNAAKQIAACLCDEAGKPVGDAAKIDKYPNDLKAKLSKIVNEVNGGNVGTDSEAANDSGTP